MTALRCSAADRGPVTFSVAMVTFARDHIAERAVAQVLSVADGRSDIEFVLVDNNPDEIDRSPWLSGFPRWAYVKIGRNKGVSARNDGMHEASGRYVVFVDDDAFLNPVGAFDVYERAFREHPRVGIVTARHRDAETGETPRACFPHTDKSLPKDKAFKTFRFQGNGFAVRRDLIERVGPMSEDYFYGIEEIDYAYRVVDAGYEILYEPRCWVVEYNDVGGRLPKRAAEEMRLTNKMIISWKYLPLRYLPLNLLLFTAYIVFLNKGRINVFRSAWMFLKWAAAPGSKRMPIGRAGQRYIQACGGQVWK